LELKPKTWGVTALFRTSTQDPTFPLLGSCNLPSVGSMPDFSYYIISGSGSAISINTDQAWDDLKAAFDQEAFVSCNGDMYVKRESLKFYVTKLSSCDVVSYSFLPNVALTLRGAGENKEMEFNEDGELYASVCQFLIDFEDEWERIDIAEAQAHLPAKTNLTPDIKEQAAKFLEQPRDKFLAFREKYKIVTLYSPNAFDECRKIGAVASAGSVMTILREDELMLLTSQPGKDYHVHGPLSNDEARDRLVTAQAAIQKQKDAISAFRRLIFSQEWEQMLAVADTLSAERKSDTSARNLELHLNAVLKNLTSCFDELDLCWQDHNNKVLYNIPPKNRRFYVLAFFKDIIGTINGMIKYHDVLFDEISDVLQLVESLFSISPEV